MSEGVSDCAGLRASVCMGLLLLPTLNIGCSSERRDGGSTSAYEPLPDWPGMEEDYDALIQDQVERARAHVHGLSHDRNLRYRDSALHIGQGLVALRTLDERTSRQEHSPVLLIANANYSMDGEPYLALHGLNLNRETYRYHVLVRDAERTVVHMVIEDTRERKERTISSDRAWDVHLMPWDTYKELAVGSEEGMLTINIGHVSEIPYPTGDGLRACAALEDRTGRMSSFLPLEPFFGCRSFEEGWPSQD